jgi:hypothetical protein
VNPTILRTYQYLVALVAIHMVVLGAANALRVIAEIALGAPSGGFTGLPFLFAEGHARPLEIYREQMSLAIALLLVGIPAWFFHWRSADRAARRAEADRSSDWRSFYLHAVMAVTALLTLGYGARTINLLARAAFFGPEPDQVFGLEPDWPARAAGAAAMVVVAAATWWWHAMRSDEDRRARVRLRAAQIRRFETYAVVFVVTLVAMAAAILLLSGIWTATVGWVNFYTSNGPDRSRIVKEAVASTVPALVLAIALVALYVRRAETVFGLPASDAIAERSSTARAVFLYLIVFIAGSGALVASSFIGGTLLSQFDPTLTQFPLGPSLSGSVPPAVVLLTLWLLAWITAGREIRRTDATGPADARRVYLYGSLVVARTVALVAAGFALQRSLRPVFGGAALGMKDFSTPVPFLMLFAAAWLYHQMIVRREARLVETAVQADTRRFVAYLFHVAAVAAAAIGIAGAVGVLGSAVLSDNTHRPDEISLYVTLSALGLAMLWAQRSLVRGTVDPAERAARQRRVALSLIVLGGAGAVLVFGSGAVFRLVNALLAADLTREAAHDLWHLLVDAAVGLVTGLYHWRILRADRALAAPAAVPPPLVLVLPTPTSEMQRRLIARFGNEGGRVFETDANGLLEVIRRLEPAPDGSQTAE